MSKTAIGMVRPHGSRATSAALDCHDRWVSSDSTQHDTLVDRRFNKDTLCHAESRSPHGGVSPCLD